MRTITTQSDLFREKNPPQSEDKGVIREKKRSTEKALQTH